MQRKIIEKLRVWKDSPYRKPLILYGARGVGKSWIMKRFGETEFENVAYFNCEEDPRVGELFEDCHVPRILQALQSMTGTKIEAGKTLIILDELQEARQGLASLKFFKERTPQYHVIAAASRHGIILEDEFFPVGATTKLKVHPMDFEEFIAAVGKESLCELLRQPDWELLNVLSAKYIDLLRQYLYVGGMPAVVSNYAEHEDLKKVRAKQREIIASWLRDISAHASRRECKRIVKVLRSLPAQLSKENKKFRYNLLGKGTRAEDYMLAIDWLMDAEMAQKVVKVESLESPLISQRVPWAFKLFPIDCGLLGCMCKTPVRKMLLGNGVFKEANGAFAEQFVHQQLTAMDIEPYYWRNPKSSAKLEFVLPVRRVIPVEVKGEMSVRSRAMETYLKSHPQYRLKGLRISLSGYLDHGWMENIPLYGLLKYIRENDRVFGKNL